jgi:hypothetical protein
LATSNQEGKPYIPSSLEPFVPPFAPPFAPLFVPLFVAPIMGGHVRAPRPPRGLTYAPPQSRLPSWACMYMRPFAASTCLPPLSFMCWPLPPCTCLFAVRAFFALRAPSAVHTSFAVCAPFEVVAAFFVRAPWCHESPPCASSLSCTSP